MEKKKLNQKEVDFLRRFPSNGISFEKLFKDKGVVRSGLLIRHLLNLARRGYVDFDGNSSLDGSPMCHVTLDAQREILEKSLEWDEVDDSEKR